MGCRSKHCPINGSELKIRRYQVVVISILMIILMSLHSLMRTKEWKTDAICNSFSPEDAQRIIAIPISPRLPPDTLYWLYTKSGKFTVRIAYHLAIQKFSTLGSAIPSNSTTIEGWMQIWNVRTLPKVRHFIWRACKDALPTRVNSVRRNMATESVCKICGEADETIEHLFVHCKPFQIVWRKGPIRFDLVAKENIPFCAMIWEIMEVIPDEGKSLISLTLWTMWLARNAFYFEGKEIDPAVIIKRAHAIFEDLLVMQNANKLQTEPSSPATPAWKPPECGCQKLNFDVAFYQDKTIGMGFIVRDYKGEALLVGVHRTRAQGPTTLLEGSALRFGLRIAIDASFANMHVEGDNSNLMAMLRSMDTHEAYSGLIIDYIRGLSRSITCRSFDFIPRAANIVAHTISHLPSAVDEIRILAGRSSTKHCFFTSS